MEAPSVAQIAQRLWSEHKYAILARSREAANDIAQAVAGGDKDPNWVVDALEDVMSQPETHLAEALDEAWHHLLPRVGLPARSAVEQIRKKSLPHFRYALAGLAERVGDAVVASSRLFDHPAAARRLWLRDFYGPTMYVVDRAAPVRISPAEVGRLLTGVYGEEAIRTLSLLAHRPHAPSELRALVDEHAPKVLEAASRLLVLRNVGGLYRGRGEALRVVLAGMGAG